MVADHAQRNSCVVAEQLQDRETRPLLKEGLLRFFIGGVVVSAFAALDACRLPYSFRI
jgi:hypothetical protein